MSQEARGCVRRVRGWQTLIFLCALFAVLACGKENRARRSSGSYSPPPAPPTPPPPPVTEARPVTVKVFGGGFCKQCKTDFPDLDARLAALPPSLRKGLTLRLYYVAGDPGNVHPDQAGADAYRNHYLPSAEAYPDLPWRWYEFRKSLPGKKLEVPAAVVVDGKGNTLKAYLAGPTTFVPAEIAAFVASALKPE